MMALASFQIMSATSFFILYYRSSLWAGHAYRYHAEVRCGYDLLNFKDIVDLMDDQHPKALEAKRRLIAEERRCGRQSKAYFHDEFYTTCMDEGARVLKWNPTVTALIIGVIVWLLQRGPLHYGTFKKPSFLISLFAILTLISVNFADFITGFLNASHKTLSTSQNSITQECGHAPAIMSIVASSSCLLSSVSVGCFIVLIYMTRIEKLDLQIKNLKEPTAPSSNDDNIIPIAGEQLKTKKVKSKYQDASENWG